MRLVLHSAENRLFARKFQTALHLLFPPRCVGCGEMVESDFGLCAECWADTNFLGEDVCDTCATPVTRLQGEGSVVCDACLKDRPPWRKARAALLYAGTGRRLVLALKHGDRTEVVRPASKWLARAAAPLLRAETVIAPVPLHRLRLLRRRYNQAALLAEALAGEVSVSYCPDLLIRRRGLGSLEGLNAEARHKKLAGAIVANPKHHGVLKGAYVLLVDDVLTSGATLKAATDACFQANATDVCVLTLARVAKGS
ncbi:double zinc ribbon domain-containing protein [Shimia sp. R9_2]|uniref:double zinc ribbon domain-containing protein n=1 Tax=Shimia sp. R9_2 TaxID=2821112 RepID=UPI0032AFCC32